MSATTTKRKGIGGHARPVRGATDIWLTPPEIVRALGDFDLDPCAAPPPRPWDTVRDHIALPDCGLTAPWRGRVWLNPPYSEVSAWLDRLSSHGSGTTIVFARTDTRWWSQLVWGCASAVHFLNYRPHFHRPDGTRANGNSGGPIALVAYGDRDAEILLRKSREKVFGGRCFDLREAST